MSKFFPIVLDLETQNPVEEMIQVEMQFAATGNCKKEETIRSKKESLKLATTDSAPIWAVGMKSQTGFLSLSQATLSPEQVTALKYLGVTAFTCKSEIELLGVYAAILSGLPQNSCIIGAGLFDSHKSRFRYAFNNLTVPDALFDIPYHDLMWEWQKYTCHPKPKEGAYISVQEMSIKMGIPFEDGMTGAEVPKAIADGRHFEVIVKNYKDCLHEEAIAKKIMRKKYE